MKDEGRSLSRLWILSKMTCRGLQDDSTEHRDWLSALTGSLMTFALKMVVYMHAGVQTHIAKSKDISLLST